MSAGSKIGWPSDRLITRMLKAVRLAIAHSMAAMTLLVEPEPWLFRTRRPINVTLGARPWYWLLRDSAPVPPMSDATCVPWP